MKKITIIFSAMLLVISFCAGIGKQNSKPLTGTLGQIVPKPEKGEWNG